MTKADIVDAVYERLGGFSKREAQELVESLVEIIVDTLASGEKVKLSGFGCFTVRSKKERMGRNPRTGTPSVITPRRVVSFRASNVLRRVLNQQDH